MTRIACVGDSITFGLGLDDRVRECYPAQLEAMLGGDFEVGNFGYSGATLLRLGHEPYWNTRSFLSASRYAADMVIVLLGANDCQEQNVPRLSHFADDLRALIDHFENGPSRPEVLLGRPAPVFGPIEPLDQQALDEIVRPTVGWIAAERELRLIDFYTPLVDHPADFPDRIHPNARGAQRLAEAANEALGARR